MAATQGVGRARPVAPCMAGASRDARRAQTTAVGAGAGRRDLPGREKGGDEVGLTRHGKGSKCEVLVSGNGVPLAAVNASASVGETSLVEPLLEQLIEAAGPDQNFWPERIIGDKAYDSDHLREVLRALNIELLSPHRENRTTSRSNDGRKMRRYKRRWKVERFFAWAGGFRRFIVRYERLRVTLNAVVNAVCLLITLRFL